MNLSELNAGEVYLLQAGRRILGKEVVTMEWEFILVLALAVPILFWVALIWAGVFTRLYLLIHDMLRQRIRVWETSGRLVRTAVIIIVPVGVYAFAIWFFLGNFGWQVALAIALALPIILFTAAFIWYLNIGGLYAAVKEGRLKVFGTIVRAMRTVVVIIVPVGIYAFAIWFSFGHFGWQVALAVALVLPIVLFVPVLIWAAVVSGLYQVVRDTLRRRVTAPRRRAVRMAEETVPRRMA